MKQRIYISAPISGYDLAERRETLGTKQRQLESIGFDVVNPLCNGLPHEASTQEHMKRDIELLLGCDAIFLMEKWCHSAGCLTELHVATAIGLEVYFEEVNTVDFNGVKFK